MGQSGEWPCAELTYGVIGAAMEVHKVLGMGFQENVYEAALAKELGTRGIEFGRQVALPVVYKGEVIKQFLADFVVGREVIVELKALEEVGPRERTQVINYLRVTGFPVGLLINFGNRSLEHHRVLRGAGGEVRVADDSDL